MEDASNSTPVSDDGLEPEFVKSATEIELAEQAELCFDQDVERDIDGEIEESIELRADGRKLRKFNSNGLFESLGDEDAGTDEDLVSQKDETSSILASADKPHEYECVSENNAEIMEKSDEKQEKEIDIADKPEDEINIPQQAGETEEVNPLFSSNFGADDDMADLGIKSRKKKAKKQKSIDQEEANPLFQTDFGDDNQSEALIEKPKKTKHRSLFDDNDSPAPKSSKKKKISLFDNLPEDDEDGDVFDFTSKPKKKKTVDLLADEQPEKKPRKSRGGQKKTMDLLSDIMADITIPQIESSVIDQPTNPAPKAPLVAAPKTTEVSIFGYRNEVTKFDGPSELRSEIRRRAEKIEKLIKSLDFSETGSRHLSSPIPSDVLRESVHRLVSDLHEKDAIIKEKELLIDFLQESVDSTFERDELLKQQNAKRNEIEAEKNETIAAGLVCEELNVKIQELEKELKDVAIGLEQSEAEARQAHEEEQYKMAMLIFEEQEPLEQKLKDAKNEKMQIEIQLMPMVEENNGMKAGIDVEAFEEMERIKAELPKKLRQVVERMRDEVGALLEGAFNPLREYTGDKIQTASRNALNAVGKKLLLK